MKPIINPIWFYFASTLDGLKEFLYIIGILIALVGAVATIVLIFGDPTSDFEEKICNIICPKYAKCLWIGLFITSLGILTPNQNTIYKIMAVNLITPNNIETVGGVTTDIIDYIVDSVDKILEENK